MAERQNTAEITLSARIGAGCGNLSMTDPVTTL